MMINKRLIAMMGDSKRYIARNVALQWVALLANIAMIFAVSAFLAGLVYGQGSLSAALLVLLGALVVRFFCTRGAASASYNASRTVKKTLRAAIYEKLLRLGGSYTQAVPTAEVLQLAGEGVEQLETYFGAYLPQFFYAMLAPLTLFIALAPVSLRAAVILMMICAVYRAPTNRSIEAAVPGTTAASHGPASKTAANTNGRSHHRRRLWECERSSCTNITPKQNMPCGRGLDFGIIENNDKRMWERFHETK